jgi:hypothetical protein
MSVTYSAVEIARIAEMLADEMAPGEIAQLLNVEAADSFFADREDDSDEGITRRYGISCDDRFDVRGRPLLSRLNDAGEPNWF